MTFNFKDALKGFSKKYVMPSTWGRWQSNRYGHAEMKKKYAKGEITLVQLQQYEHDFALDENIRQKNWQKRIIQKELQEKEIKDFQLFKENPKAFFRKMDELGMYWFRWWMQRPIKPMGSGKLKQHPITGQWIQEYKPKKTMRMKKWLQAADSGNVMLHMNPNRKPLNRMPTEEERLRSDAYKRKRESTIWQQVLNMTNNFGRGFDIKDKTRPGKGLTAIGPNPEHERLRVDASMNSKKTPGIEF